MPLRTAGRISAGRVATPGLCRGVTLARFTTVHEDDSAPPATASVPAAARSDAERANLPLRDHDEETEA